MGKVLGTLGTAVKVRGTTAQYVVDHTIPGRTLRIPHGMLSLIADDGTVFKSIEANTPPGTHGCIGLVAQTRQQLEEFRDLLNTHTSGGSHLFVTVKYTPSSGVS
jgi:hypothetical protein